MGLRTVLLTLNIFFLILSSITVSGKEKTRKLGPYTMYEQIIYPAKQQRILYYLSHDYAQGRESGTPGAQMSAEYIRDLFEQYGLQPLYGESFYQPFMADSTTKARNVVGIVPSSIPSDEYIIVAAHYDHLGTINGAIYNGADDNGSGVTALLNLADMFGTMKKTKTGPDKNIIFVALDGKEKNMAGSKHFVKNLGISTKKIKCAINLERIGTIIEPVHDNDTNFVIVLGEKTLRKADRGKITMCNNYYNIDLDIDFTFYGSEKFTELYYQLSDQIVFHEAGIPSLLFTSGFHKHTYKVTDDHDIISYPVLKKRTLLVFYFIMML